MMVVLLLPLHPIDGPAEHHRNHDGLYGMHCLIGEGCNMPEYLSQNDGHCDTWRVIQSGVGWCR